MGRFSIITFGCTLNKSDSAKMQYILQSSNYEFVENPKDAEIVIVNTCTVKTPSENKAIKVIKQLKKEGKLVIVTGCLAQHQPELFKEFPIVGTYQIDKIKEAIELALMGEKPKFLEKDKIEKIKINSLDVFPIKIIPIQEGCLWKCSYCATKFSRSILHSYRPRDIYEVLKNAIVNGFKVIYFTGTDLAAYGFDLGIDLADLLHGLREIEGFFLLRVGMANPGILNKFIDRLLKAYEDPRIFKFFHIPVQTASNRILEDMKRKYTIEEFYELVQKIRNKYPEASIATDIIVGYPTETEEDFKLTLQMIEEIKFDVINISRFWPRPGTEAYNLKPLKGEIVKERSRKVTDIFNKTAKERNKIWLNWEGWCIIESKGTKENTWIGRNYAYKQVVVKSNQNLLGKFVKVKIKEITAVDLRGIIQGVKDNIDVEEWISNRLYG